MASYSAVFGDARSIGAAAGSNLQPANAPFPRLNPQLSTARIRTVINPHIVSDAVGGLISCDFLIPAEEAVRYRPSLRYGAVVWLFDGLTPLFMGYAEQPVWTATGDCQINVAGPWTMLNRARTREAWDVWDLSLYTRGIGANENKAGQANINSDGTVTLSFPNGTVVANNDRVSLDFFLFGEVAATADSKLLTAFEFDITDAVGLGAVKRFKVIGRDAPGGSTADVLYDTGSTGASGRQGAQNLHGTNQGGTAWSGNQGYRCLRFQFIFNTGSTIAADNYVTLDRIRVSSRENLFPAAGNTIDTAALARDVLTINTEQFTGVSIYRNTQVDVPAEFFLSGQTAPGIAGDNNTFTYPWGLDPLIGTVANTGIGTSGFSALEWQSPADILTSLAAIDGSHVGFYLPYNGRGGYDPPGANYSGFPIADVGSFWLTAPPQLFYQQFSDPVLNPDYTVHIQEGAVVTPATDAQPLVNYLYTNYQTIKGRPQSVVVQDTAQTNYAFQQGYRRVEEFTIQPSIGDNQTPTTQAQQYMAQRRLAVSSATVSIENDGSTRYPILRAGGCAVPRLAQIRPGSVNINGSSVAGTINAGYATHVEWWGASDTANEYVELSITQPPGQRSRQAVQGHLTNRTHRTRHRGLW